MATTMKNTSITLLSTGLTHMWARDNNYFGAERGMGFLGEEVSPFPTSYGSGEHHTLPSGFLGSIVRMVSTIFSSQEKILVLHENQNDLVTIKNLR